MITIGINGYGRIGRLVHRATLDRAYGTPSVAVGHINDPGAGAEVAAHLLEFDTVHGRAAITVAAQDGAMAVDGRTVTLSGHAAPGDIPWGELGVDVVLDCSGRFRTPDALQGHFDQGAKIVIVSAPVKSGAVNVVVGCNDGAWDPARDRLITAASCTTNCLAPLVKVVHEALGIRHGQITTIHDVTNTQVIVDAPHKDLRRARSALNSLVPTTTGSATAIALIYPELEGKLNGHAVRVPLLNASLTDAVFEVERPTDAEEVNALMRAAAQGPLAGILGVEERPLVSADFVNDTRSSILDAPSTMVVDGTSVKLFAWYDNETGYAYRMLDLANRAARSLEG